jgi:hypothetical protein
MGSMISSLTTCVISSPNRIFISETSLPRKSEAGKVKEKTPVLASGTWEEWRHFAADTYLGSYDSLRTYSVKGSKAWLFLLAFAFWTTLTALGPTIWHFSVWGMGASASVSPGRMPADIGHPQVLPGKRPF